MWSGGITRLSQRLARFVRMTLSFSKSELMHEACLLLFLHRYNLGSGISEKDMVDCESQFQMNKMSIQW